MDSREKGASMRLIDALTVFEVEGPANPRDGGQSAKARATKVLYSFLHPGEIQELNYAWKNKGESKAVFLGKLSEIVDRLKLGGFV